MGEALFSQQLNSAEIVPFNKEDRYKKSNLLISSKYSSCLLDNQILAMATQSIKETNDGQIQSVMPATEIKALLKKNYCQAYEELKKASLRIKKNYIMIEDPEQKRFHISSLITDCDYANGTFTLTWNSSLRSTLFSLKNYTLLSLTAMVSWKSNVTFRLYEVLKAECYTPKGFINDGNVFTKTINLSELKVTLGAVDLSNDRISMIANKYQKAPDFDKMLAEIEELAEKYPNEKLKPKWQRWADFQRQVLKPACEEMNNSATSDLHVKYEPIQVGKGGRVTAVRFTMELISEKSGMQRAEEKSADTLTEDEKLEFFDEIKEIVGIPIKTTEAKAIAEAAGYDMAKIEKAVQVMNASRTDIANVTGFITSAIKDGYEVPTSKKKKESAFGGFKQRDIDFEALEKEAFGQ